jgi:hypothetical protein
MKLYSIEEIKKAFWTAFHGSGELWFDYFGSEEDCNDATESYWKEFEKNLEDPEGK